MNINKYIRQKLKRLNNSKDRTENKIAKLDCPSDDNEMITLINKYDNYNNEIKKYEELKEILYDILDESNYDQSKKQLDKLITNIDQYKGKIKTFIKNRLRDQFKTFNRWKEDDNIERTSNLLELEFLLTMPGTHKRIYKTIEGIMARIHLNEERRELNKNRRKYYPKKNPT